MDAILLAGGKGERMGQVGKLIYKPLLPVPTKNGIQPVINSNVDELLRLEGIQRIFVLIKEEHRDQFSRWNKVYYGSEKRVILKYEEELSTGLSRPGDRRPGAVWGLYLALKKLRLQCPVLVLAADNYFTDDFAPLLQSHKANRRPMVVYRDLRFPEMVRQRYGVIRLAQDRQTIEEFVEKPEKPSATDTRAALAFYIFNDPTLKLLAKYVEDTKELLEAPGQLIQWLIRQTSVQAFEFKNRWWDVGTREDYADVLRMMSRHEVRTVGHLLKAKLEGSLPDAYFLMGRRFVFETKAGKRTMKILFKEEDELCRKDAAVFGEGLKTIDEIKAAAGASRQLKDLEDAIAGKRRSRGPIEFPSDVGVLLSGGVFLYDAPPPENRRLRADASFVPLLERDYAAPADPGRLTTPAGRLDDVNISGLCFSELLEEMVFYGLDDSHNVRIFTVFPWRLIEQYEPKRLILKRLLEKNVRIPGLDLRILSEQGAKPEGEIDIVQVLYPVEVQLPPDPDLPVWNVEIQIEGRQAPESEESVYVVLDRPNCTIEFRKVVCVELSKYTPLLPGGKSRWPPGANMVGRLMGIADGDGYKRRTLVIAAKELAEYYDSIMGMSKERLVEYLFSSETTPITITAVGDGGDAGRFTWFNASVPALSLTTSVREMARLTSRLMKRE